MTVGRRWALPALMLAACTTGIGSASAAQAVCRHIAPGLVIGFEGGTTGYVFEHGGRRVPLYLYSELVGGDRLQVLAANGRLVVQASDGGTTTLIRTPALICVDPGARAGVVSNFLRSVGEQFTKRRDGPSGDLVSRGDGEVLAFAPADLASGEARVAAATRRLTLSWWGGRPPFAARITRHDMAVLDEKKLTARIVRTRADRDLAPGDYVATVVDSDGRTVSALFSVFQDPSAVPAPASSEAALVRAAALLSMGKDRVFDAMMVLSPYRETDSSARTLMDVLRWDSEADR